jgi:DNA-binding response OmpR family regulator
MARILVIDDDDALRRMLRLTLEHFGHTVVEARDGKEGMCLILAANVALVITDIVMPEKEGFEVLMELRGKFPSMKVLAISGGGRNRTTDYLQMAEFLGATKVLAKPFSNEALMGAVNELLLSEAVLAQAPRSGQSLK